MINENININLLQYLYTIEIDSFSSCEAAEGLDISVN
jgi:hypothetical protein